MSCDFALSAALAAPARIATILMTASAVDRNNMTYLGGVAVNCDRRQWPTTLPTGETTGYGRRHKIRSIRSHALYRLIPWLATNQIVQIVLFSGKRDETL
jgi:hypothetical protein